MRRPELTARPSAECLHTYSRLCAGGANQALGHFTTILNWGKAQGHLPYDLPNPTAPLRKNRRIARGRLLNAEQLRALSVELNKVIVRHRVSAQAIRLFLLRAGYGYVPYASLENVIEENKDIYYKSLRRTQTTLKGNAPDWTPWIGFFLRCLKKQKNNLVVRLDREQSETSDADMPELSMQILELFDKHPRLNLSKIVDLTGSNKNTIKVRLRELVSSGHIVKHGKARATWYVKA